ncbi:HSP20-like chaperone [Annulohypoxylon moriforme]|nr:HSP20-like chaperone [Annulohypoxylon moriforme]
MANNNNNNQPRSFWEHMQSFDPHASMRAGAGVDHTNTGPNFGPGFPFNNAQTWPGQEWARSSEPWNGWHGWHGWHGGRGGGRHGFGNYREVPRSDREEDEKNNDHEDDDEMESSPETMRNTPGESVNSEAPPPPPPGAFPHPPPPPPAGAPQHPPHLPHPFHHGHPFGGPHRGRGRFGRRGGRHGPHPPPPSYTGPWDFRPLMHAFATHPFAEAFRDYMEQAREGLSGESDEQQQDNAFTPPVDVFNTEKAYILHVSLPGANKEDVGVNWDGEKVNIAGVVYRPGDEEFISCLASSERKVGMFERSIKLPPPGSDQKEEIDSVGITAKMENGILIVTVPKTEKEWTQIHKVEVQ